MVDGGDVRRRLTYLSVLVGNGNGTSLPGDGDVVLTELVAGGIVGEAVVVVPALVVPALVVPALVVPALVVPTVVVLSDRG